LQIVGTAVQPAQAVIQPGAGGDDQQRHRVVRGAQVLQQLQAILPRQPKIEQDLIISLRAQGRFGSQPLSTQSTA
jgi:hypothetical protein